MDGAPRLTIEERILLVLADHIRFAEDFELPSSMTQEGLARAVGAMRPNVARSLKALKAKGTISERLAHVAGQRRRKKVYLVQPGKVEEVLRLRDQTSSVRVPSDRGSRTLGEIAKEMGVPLYQAYGELIARPPSQGPSVPMEGTIPPGKKGPKIGFYGRSIELRRLADWLEDDRSSFAFIWGMAGIGKSALIERFRGGLKGWDVIYYRFMPLNSLPGVVHSLEVALSASLKIGPGSAGRMGSGGGMEDLVRDLVRSLSAKGRTLLILDDLHLSNKEFLDLLASMMAHDARGIKVIAASRMKGQVYNARDAGPSGKVMEMELAGLSEEDGSKMLFDRGLPMEAARELCKRCDGHPIALSLAPAGPWEGPTATVPMSDAEGFLLMEVIGKLDAGELAALRLLSVLRGPMRDPYAFLRDASSDPSLADNLSARGLLRSGPMGYEVHPLIAEAATRRLTKEDWARLHSLAADKYLREAWDLENILEASYHLSSSGRLPEMISLLRDNRTMVLEEGFVEAALLLEGPDTSALSPRDKAYHRFLLGTSLEAMGERQGARRELRAAFDIAAKEGVSDLSLLFGLECSMGRLLRNSGDLKGAVERWRSALKVYERIREPTDQDQSLCIFTHNALGSSASDLKDERSALEQYLKAEELTSSYDPGNMLPTILHNKGRALMELERNDEARAELENGLALAEELHDEMTLTSFHETLGELSADEGRMDEAFDHFEKALAGAVSSSRLSDAGDRYMHLGRRGTASGASLRRPLRERVLGFMTGRGKEEAMDLSRIYTRICRMERDRGLMPSMDLHEKAARLFSERGLLRGSAKALNNLGLANKKAGRPEQAASAYRKALEISERAKDDKGMAITLFNLGSLMVQIGNAEEGASCLERALPLLRSAGLKEAAASAAKMLKDIGRGAA